MRRRVLPLVMLVLAAVVAYNSYSLFKMGGELETISGRLVQAPTEESKSMPPLDVIVIKHAQCRECPDLRLIAENLKSQLNIREIVELDENTGRSLVMKYQLKRLPVVVFSAEMEQYAEIAANWQLFGERAEDGSYLLTKANPPFMDLETGEVSGLVSLTNVVDKTCEECYDVGFHKTVLA
ncbi:hypothetical protein HY501_00695, partial [Candidatus Woesearchaeota archaeon]|nr:hypothetical protein [Candidatus Woesearchaeota archaeon]